MLEIAQYRTHTIIIVAFGTLYKVRFEFKVEKIELKHVSFCGIVSIFKEGIIA